MEYEQVIELIKSKMADKGYTQRALAEYCGTTEVSISRYFNGIRTMPYSIMIKCFEMLGFVFMHYDLARDTIELKVSDKADERRAVI